jgi:hypothetical protein
VNYQKLYDRLIERAIHRSSISGYKETHHIVPKSMGGTDDHHNLVDLTAREHFIAHNCLARIYGGREWYAVVRMAKQCQVTNSRLFEIARIKRSEEHKKGGWKHTDAERQAKSLRQTGKKASPERSINISAAKKGKPLSELNRLALRGKRGSWSDARRQAQKSVVMPPSQAIKISKALKGRKKSPEHVLAAAQGRKKSTFNRKCIALNALIDSVFQPEVVMTSA